MSFAHELTDSVARYVNLQRSLGYQFSKQAASLNVFLSYVHSTQADGPLSQALALQCVIDSELTPNGRAIHYAVIRRFAEYHIAFDPLTESFDKRALPRNRAVAPPRILSEQELESLMKASRQISFSYPLRGQTISTVIGLMASTGLRSGEALRLNQKDVDFAAGVLQILKTKFRKDRLVPVHASTLVALKEYVYHRDLTFPALET